jgi:hypothetical protein
MAIITGALKREITNGMALAMSAPVTAPPGLSALGDFPANFAPMIAPSIFLSTWNLLRRQYCSDWSWFPIIHHRWATWASEPMRANIQTRFVLRADRKPKGYPEYWG